ncbi:hypothetical protein VNO80_15811 [Phaseolus coccineus]|uniref:Uncharacterized protein n=1 Tax=Phaseolus coccineus TaxID=3886 RepID=A0AAN9R7B7_PHACN
MSFKALPPAQGPTDIQVLNTFHPFTEAIMQVQLPDSLRWSNAEKFNGMSNPNARVKAYFMLANLLTRDQRIHYRLFPYL